MKLLVTLMLGLLLSGCVSMYRYQEPTDGPRARVRFVSYSLSPAILRKYDDEKCMTNEQEMMRLKMGTTLMGSNTGPRQIGIPLWTYKGEEAKEAYVDASKPFNAMFFGTEKFRGMINFCAIQFTFQPEDGKDYEVVYNFLAPDLSKGNNCSVVAYEIVKKADDSYGRRKVPLENHSEACRAAFTKRRLY